MKETQRQTERSTPQISATTELHGWSRRNNFMCRCSQKSPRRDTLPRFLLLSNDSLNSPRCPAPGTHLSTCFCYSASLQGVSVCTSSRGISLSLVQPANHQSLQYLKHLSLLLCPLVAARLLKHSATLPVQGTMTSSPHPQSALAVASA